MYNVKPFSGKHYAKNSAKAGDKTPCAICGKAIRNPDTAHYAVVIDGGGAWGDETSDPNDAGYMGGFPIGPDCHRKHFAAPAAYFAIEDSQGVVPAQFATREDVARALCDTCNTGQPEGRYVVVPLARLSQSNPPSNTPSMTLEDVTDVELRMHAATTRAEKRFWRSILATYHALHDRLAPPRFHGLSSASTR